MTITLRDRYQGCLLAGAVGDALGASIEFMSITAIKEQFGINGLTDYAPAYGRFGAITDDTQMTLFTAEGLLRALALYKTKGVSNIEGCVNHSYLRWALTQGTTPYCDYVETDSWLFQVRELHARRAPGTTCITALQTKTDIDDLYANNNSKGCGSIMRIAPVALMYSGQATDEHIKSAYELGGNLARLTHGHPTSTASSGVLAALVLQLIAGRDLNEALIAALDLLNTEIDDEYAVFSALVAARDLARSDDMPTVAIGKLGGGWVAEEALAIAVYACLRDRTLEETLLIAVNHSGDSDSTGSIAGNLAGAMYGVQAIPEKWLERLELREVIQEVADDLHDCGSWGQSQYADTSESKRIMKKYPS